ncbi:hypothetical protein BH11PSE8_BH11PSE8_32100 [soil metagenome]
MNAHTNTIARDDVSAPPGQNFVADRAIRLTSGGGDLSVVEGQVWLTRRADLSDHVLLAGQHFRLRAGEEAVIEPWQTGESATVAWQPRPQGLAALAFADALRAFAFLAGRGAAGLAALARSAASSASRAQGCIAAGDSIASSGAVR